MYPAQQMQVYGRCLSADDLLALKETLHCSDRVKGYLLFAESPADSNGGFLDGFCGDMTRLMSIYESENAEKDFLLKALDFMDNPLCIYDREAIFRYGNSAYCNVMNISDRESCCRRPRQRPHEEQRHGDSCYEKYIE